MSSGITQPDRTFVQPVVKTLQTLLGFIKNEMDSYSPCWESPQTVSHQTMSWQYARPWQPAWARAMPGNVLTIEQLVPSRDSVQAQALAMFSLLVQTQSLSPLQQAKDILILKSLPVRLEGLGSLQEHSSIGMSGEQGKEYMYLPRELVGTSSSGHGQRSPAEMGCRCSC